MMRADVMTCTMPTSTLRLCTRPARYAYVAEGYRPNGSVVAAYCAQHARAGGHARILRPAPWEFSRIIDLASGITLAKGSTP